MPRDVRSVRAWTYVAAATACVLLAFAAALAAQTGYQPSPENLKSRAWFEQARFGLFVHWGIYSELGAGEWVMQTHHLSGPQYEQLAAQFYPVKFDAAQWVALAKQAGVRYIVVTSRHHDGFSMFATKQSKYNVADATPYGKDVIRQLADECHRQDIKLFVYYSQLDWHHPDYYPLGGTGQWEGRPRNGQWSRYLDFMNAQLSELFTNYGELGGVWLDGMWDKADADWQLPTTYALIHRLQPGALIVSNHHKQPNPGEDVQTFEKDLPGENTTGWGGAAVSQLPLEVAETMYGGGTWGFDLRDTEPKSLPDLVQYLVRAAGNNANLLLNVGPMPDGEIQRAFANRLREIGSWLETYGESIYGTQGGPVKPGGWGVTTRRGNLVYVHVLDPTLRVLALSNLDHPVGNAHLLNGRARVAYSFSQGSLVLDLPRRGARDIDQVIVLQLVNP
jgi:alpha-L-fucosidase